MINLCSPLTFSEKTAPPPPFAPTLRSAEPVNGPHSITATLNCLDDILQWQEGRCQFDHGYYRFIENPIVARLQKALQRHFQRRHCLVYTSWKSATMELLDYLLLASHKAIKVVSDCEMEARGLQNSLSGLNASLHFCTPENLSTLLPFSGKKDEILVIHVKQPLEFLEAQKEWLQIAKTHRLPVVVVSDQFPETLESAPQAHYWVVPLNKDHSALKGGAILSNKDRQMAELKTLRIQRGPILSSRNATYFLGESTSQPTMEPTPLIEYFCQLEQAQYGFLFPSGMQAITTLLHLVSCPEKSQMVAIGHLYTDTYALLNDPKQRKGSHENQFIGVDEMERFPEVVTNQTAAIITETITNPLNDVPDLEAIFAISQPRNIPVIVDNTFATPYNCKPLTLGADFVLHSTTKYFNGENDHGGGVILLNNAEAAARIQHYQEQWDNGLSPLENAVLWKHLQDFEERMVYFQKNALCVAEFLENHPQVEKLYFHHFPSHRSYKISQRLLTGPSSVLSFTLKRHGLEGLRRFYDAPLPHILKAPSLGSNQTILCPYTLLAHYHESDETLQEIGLPRYLIRLSVGCEKDIAPILESLNQAL